MRLGEYVLPLGERTLIMGVLNVTPDSFSDGGIYSNTPVAVRRAIEMEAEGADIIDIGGESSRPGSQEISADEEIERVLPVIKGLKDKINIPISVDTWKSEVASEALRAGAVIVNDITALNGDEKMASCVAEHDAAVVLMHMKGKPLDMQDDPAYTDVVEDIILELTSSIEKAASAGIDPEKIIIDPGIGFGKTLEHNLIILRRLSKLRKLEKPVLVGTSRKSFIGEITGKDTPDRFGGTAASGVVAIMNGADIVRVHDVMLMKDVTKVVNAITGA